MYFITVSNGLLEQKHYKKMGAAVWQFMWLIDKITRIDDKGDGWVLGGKPINLEDIKLGGRITTSRNLQKLEKEKYICLNHTPYGIIITVKSAKKRFNDNVKPRNRNDKPIYKVLDNTGDNTNTLKGIEQAQPYGDQNINEIINYLLEKQGLKDLDGSVKWNRIYAKNLLKKFKNDPVRIKNFIDFTLSDPFHQRNATSMKYLYMNLGKISLKAKQLSESTAKI